MSEKVEAYIEIYNNWRKDYFFYKYLEVLAYIRESMTKALSEATELSLRIIPLRY